MSSILDIVVVGSLNMDMIMQTPRIPAAGETLLSGQFSTAPGGKGANQAVAAARLGAGVAMIGCVGQDAFGSTLIQNLQNDRVQTEHILQLPAVSSGTALIMVEPDGENRIIVASGANFSLSPEHIEAETDLIKSAKALVLQLETPIDTITCAARIAHQAGVKVILNPAPAQSLPPELLANVDILIPNYGEALELCSLKTGSDAYELAYMLHQFGPETIIITLADQGALLSHAAKQTMLPAFRIDAVDTTAAGDAFIGGLAAALSKDKTLEEAVRWASAAGALACTKLGAQPSLPELEEIIRLINAQS